MKNQQAATPNPVLTSTAPLPDRQTLAAFRTVIADFYRAHGRTFAWREQITPYRVFISEVMLQQTQTARVTQKFPRFLEAFPDFASLAAAPFAEVLGQWKGLGYNRRARYLQESARVIVTEHGSRLPDEPEELLQLPGIGAATAASICVFAYNRPLPFIETNLRTVYIHFFFPDQDRVSDRDILPLVESTLDRERPREWYYALMDYGVMLKKTVGNLSRRSLHYSRQSPFEGSDRQLRGRLLQLLLERGQVDQQALPRLLGESVARCARILEALQRERLVTKRGDTVVLS